MRSHERTLLSSLGFADKDKASPLHDLACQFLAEPEQHALILASVVKRHPEWLRADADPCAVAKERTIYKDLADKNGRMVQRDFQASGSVTSLAVPVTPARTEVPISKGEGQYKTTIGFIDVVLPFYVHYDFHGGGREKYSNECHDVMWSGRGRCEASGRSCDEWCSRCRERHRILSEQPLTLHERLSSSGKIHIEAKIERCSVGDLIRQVNLYRQYEGLGNCSRWTFQSEWLAALAFDITETDAAALRSANIHGIRLGARFNAWVEAQRAKSALAYGESF